MRNKIVKNMETEQVVDKKIINVNPFSLFMPAPVCETKTFSEGEHQATIKFKKLNGPEQIAAENFAYKMIEKYMGVDGNPPAYAFPLINGQQIVLSEYLIKSCSYLFISQQVQEGVQPYQFESFVALSATLPAMFSDIFKFYSDLNKEKKDEDPGNG
jgi:hypothetical protein